MSQFQTEAAQKLWELYQRYKGEVGGMTGMFLASLAPGIPAALRSIDESPELRQQIADIIREVGEAFEEEVKA